MMPRLFLAIMVVAGLAMAGPARAQGLENPPPRLDLPTGVVAVISQTGRVHRFDVEFATTRAAQARGLMFREEMPANEGMLFLFPDVRRRSFWMQNTLIPLDIIFIGPDSRILNIAAMTEPLSEEGIPSDGPAAAVLEINGGLSAMLGIRPGDLVQVVEAPGQ